VTRTAEEYVHLYSHTIVELRDGAIHGRPTLACGADGCFGQSQYFISPTLARSRIPHLTLSSLDLTLASPTSRLFVDACGYHNCGSVQ